MNFQHFLEMLEIMLEHFQKRCAIKIVTNVIVFSKKVLNLMLKSVLLILVLQKYHAHWFDTTQLQYNCNSVVLDIQIVGD